MENENSVKKSSENRLLAAIAHATVITQGLGILISIIIYRHLRDRAPEQAFQALQAAAFQLVALLAVIISWIVWTFFYFLSFIPMMNLGPTDAPPPIFWIALASMIIPLLIMIFFVIYGLVGGVRALSGKPFKYPLIGNWLEESAFWKESTL